MPKPLSIKDIDKDTLNVLSEGETLKFLTEHSGWGIARRKLMDKIIDLQSIKNIRASSPEEVVADIKARNAAVDILMEWLKEIEGAADQYAANKVVLEETDVFIRLE